MCCRPFGLKVSLKVGVLLLPAMSEMQLDKVVLSSLSLLGATHRLLTVGSVRASGIYI